MKWKTCGSVFCFSFTLYFSWPATVCFFFHFNSGFSLVLTDSLAIVCRHPKHPKSVTVYFNESSVGGRGVALSQPEKPLTNSDSRLQQFYFYFSPFFASVCLLFCSPLFLVCVRYVFSGAPWCEWTAELKKCRNVNDGSFSHFITCSSFPTPLEGVIWKIKNLGSLSRRLQFQVHHRHPSFRTNRSTFFALLFWSFGLISIAPAQLTL